MTEQGPSLTPLDIQKKEFSTSFRGFDVKEVQTFLGMITEEMEALLRKNQDLRESLEAKDEEIAAVKEQEASLRRALEGLERVVTEERARAQEKGERIVREAEVKAGEILVRAKEEQAALQNEIRHLKRLRREFVAKLGSLVDSYRKIIEQDQKALDQEVELGQDVQMI